MFSGFLEGLPQLCKSAWENLERALVLRRQPARGVERLFACVITPQHYAHSPGSARLVSRGQRDDEYVAQRHELARAHQEALHARRVAVVAGVELERVLRVLGAC